ncbi:MAG: TetR/AcrR family transcriptional regulator [Coriobacteriales bacterium]|nr:TetR/AcrR family transcriptional regulator [Coriobacteriales bacterium]
MPPKVKFQKEEIVAAALNVAKRKGLDGVTAREVATELGVSTRPIFTYYDTMDQLKADVYTMAREHYRSYVELGTGETIPFLGVGRQFVSFAKQEPHLFELLFLTKPNGANGGVKDAYAYTKELVRDSIMDVYNMNAVMADSYFRNLWLVVFSFATMIVTDDCPFSDEQMVSILSEISLSTCKAYKEVPGMPEGVYNRDEVFQELVHK